MRTHRVDVAERARAELAACSSSVSADGGVKACAAQGRLALLAGVLTLSENDAAGAVTLLSSAKPGPDLEAFRLWYLGEAQAWNGAEARAVSTLQKARKGAPQWLQKRIDLRSAELWVRTGQADKAKPILEAAADEDPTPELLYARALTRQALGEADGARAALRVIFTRYPTHPHATLAKMALEKTGPLKLSFDEQLARTMSQLNAGASEAALKTVEAVEPPVTKNAKARLALVHGQALLARGRDADGLAELEVAIATGSPPVAADAMMTKARRFMRQSENAKARAAFQALDERFPADLSADEAGYLASWIAMHEGDNEMAARDFAAFEKRHGDSKKRDEARWFQAFSWFRSAKYREAREVCLSLVADFPRSSLVPQAKYWAARSAQLTPARDGGVAKVDVAQEFRELITSWGGTFYALLATERLRELGVEPPRAFTQKPKSLVVKTPPALSLAQTLARAGLLRDAGEEVQRAVASVSSSADAMTYGHALQAMNEFGPAYSLAARHLWGAVYTLHQPEAVALMYPRAFQQSVERACTDHGLDPFLAWAIMRRESAFRPEVISSADARGLMQLIPPTAKAIATELKVDAPDPDELYSPEINVHFGTWYLSALLGRLGHPSLCAASYNAGPSSVVKWLGQRGTEPLDQWVEEIPFKETRGYVKQVTADYFVYQQLYGDAVGRLALTLPSPKPVGVSF